MSTTTITPATAPEIDGAPTRTAASRPMTGFSIRTAAKADEPYFASPQGLRRLLVSLLDGETTWRTHPDVPALMSYCADKYALLARRYRQTPHDAALAAFEVLRVPATIDADDPWGVVTHAVQLTLKAQDRADGLLCSVDRARHLMTSGEHDAARFSEYDDEAVVPRAVEHLAAQPDQATPDDESAQPPSSGIDLCPADVDHALRTVRAVLVAAGWPREVASVGLDYLCERLRLAGDETTAFEYLRRDVTPLFLLDIERAAWTRLCRALLGSSGHPGLLRRVLVGESVLDLLRDQSLLTALRHRPGRGREDVRGAAVRHG